MMLNYKEKQLTDESIDVPIDRVVDKIAENLSRQNMYLHLKYDVHYDIPKPSLLKIKKTVFLLREILLPGYFSEWKTENRLQEEVREKLTYSYQMLSEEAYHCYCFEDRHCTKEECHLCIEKANLTVKQLFLKLPKIRKMLLTDIRAAYEQDPAAKSVDEVILSYPSIKAIINYRIGHELHLANLPLIPRIITELGHTETGIDIHPGAKIGQGFFIDHGTGVVIGETTEIGKNVKLYQGVTLGAKSFSLDEQGNPVKGIPRHPIVEDDVIIYSNASILGRIRIGKASIIGSNVTLLRDVAPGTKIVQTKPIDATFLDGAGI